MTEQTVACVLFDTPGRKNTEATLRIARERAEALGIGTILVASTVGTTGVEAARLFAGYNVVVVTHSQGFGAPDTQGLLPENRAAIEAAGARILTCQHTFGGVGRAVRRKLGTYELEEIVAFTYRTFCEGVKVVAEMTLMAADAGLVRTDEEIIVIAGTGRGADTAAVVLPAHAQDFFDLEMREILCKPRIRGKR